MYYANNKMVENAAKSTPDTVVYYYFIFSHALSQCQINVHA